MKPIQIIEGAPHVIKQDGNKFGIEHKMAIYATQSFDEAVIEKIREIAKENGIQSVCLLDTTAILAAFTEYEAKQQNPGEVSDGYHTFNELYDHRIRLFLLICAMLPKLAWKSKKHHDGTMYDGMFVAGLITPYGQVNYHMDIDPYWDLFKVEELDAAPEWDGHTPKMAAERISALAADIFLKDDDTAGIVE